MESKNYVILDNIVTEKSTAAQGRDNSYTFKVNVKASKGAIANEVEKAFKVDVINVRTMIMPGKKRRVRRTPMFRTTKRWKKAVVTIKEGQQIKTD